MKRITTVLRALNEREEGHAAPLIPTLAGAAGAIVLAIGAAADSTVTAVIGGVVLAVGLLGTTVLQQRGRCPTQHIDESRSYGQTFGVDFMSRTRSRKVSDGSNRIAGDGYIARVWRRAGAIINHAVADNQIKIRWR